MSKKLRIILFSLLFFIGADQSWLTKSSWRTETF